MGFQQTLDLIRSTKEQYDVRSVMVDTAACASEAAGFTSWSSDVTNKATGATQRITAIEIDIFGGGFGGGSGAASGAASAAGGGGATAAAAHGGDPAHSARLTDVWLFRDPMDFEVAMLRA